MERPIDAVPFNFGGPSQMEFYGKERKRQEVLDDGEGHKRQKVLDDGKEYGNVVSDASLHGKSEQMKPKNSSSVTNYSDPFAVTTLLERLDSGKFGSVTRDIESLIAQNNQMLQPYFLEYPKLIKVFLEGEKHQPKDSSKLADKQPSDPNCRAIAVLENASAENRVLAAPPPVVIIDSDDEEDVGRCRPLFHDIVLPKPPGELDMNDLLVRDPPPRKARKTGRPSVDTETKKEKIAVDTEIKKDKGVYVGIEEEGEGNQSDNEDDNLNDIWKEMNMALESSKDAAVDPSSEEHDKENEQDCDHSYVLKDDLGYVCRVCGVIDRGIDTIFEFQFNKVKRSTRTYVSDYRNAKDRESTGKLGVELSENDLKVTEIAAHPRHMKQMKPHQVEGFNFLVNNLVSDTPGGCILAHAPGSGKTFMIISFMQSFLAKYPHARPLVVLPKGILSTWKKEFQTWQVEDIPLLDLYTGKVDNRYQQLEVLKQWVEQRSILFLGYKQFSTIVCDSATNNISASCQEILLKAPSILILDEGHTPRNENTDVLQSLAKVQTPRKVVLSGTLYQNHVKEVFNILNLVRPKFLRLETSRSVVKRILSRVQISGVRKQFKAGVDSAFYELVEHSLHKDEDFKRKVTVIHDLREMTSNVLHYYKGDFLDELPGLVDFTVVLNLSPRQKCEMDKLKKLSRKFKISSVGSAVSVHPKLNSVSEQFAKTDDKIDDLLEKLDMKDGVKAKFYLNMLKLCELSDEKLLVFSQYLLPLKFLERLTVKYKGWSVGKQIFVISGETSSENREWSMERFNNSPDAKVFFGSIKACGEGISLVGASRVIILDVHLNPSVTRQAVGRAFRPGQKKKVFTYRLVAANSPEEEDHSTCFKKESIAKMWFEWNEYCGFRAFEMETVDANESGDVFFDNPMLVEDVKALYKR